ncbi:MAG: DUF2586 family protein [Myxococcales bacterium]|nr:DUF2586 family protein [Myxococcales bacterium]
MPLPDVAVSALDFQLGALPVTAEGIHAKVGVASIATDDPIVIGSLNDVRTLLGYGPLANACADSLMNGAKSIIAHSVAPATLGSIGSQSYTGTGTLTPSVGGAGAYDAFDLIVRIIKAGTLNEATFEYSLNGGASFVGPFTVPSGGTFVIDNTGITLTFSGTFAAGNQLTATTTAPEMNVGGAAAGIDALLDSPYAYEFVHVVGASDSTFWTSCASKASTAEGQKRWIHFVCEGRKLSSPTSTWITNVLGDAASFADTRVSVVAGWLSVQDPILGISRKRNGAGVYCGRLSSLPVQRSPGRVQDGALKSVLGHAAALTDAQIEQLDNARYVTFRTFINAQTAVGMYVTLPRTMAVITSDYKYVMNRRVMDKALRLVREAAIPFLQDEVDLQPDASSASLARFQAVLEAPLDQMAADKEIVSGRVVIPEGQNIVGTSTIEVEVKIVPVGYMNYINATLGFELPEAS